MQLPAGHFTAKFISPLASKNVNLSQLSEGEPFGMVDSALNLFLRQIRNKFAEISGAKFAVGHTKFHDAVEASGSSQNRGVESSRVVRRGHHNYALLCSHAVQAIQQTRQTYSGW